MYRTLSPPNALGHLNKVCMYVALAQKQITVIPRRRAIRFMGFDEIAMPQYLKRSLVPCWPPGDRLRFHSSILS